MTTTTVLTIAALDMGADRLINYMGRVCRGYATTGGRKQISVPNKGRLDPSAGEYQDGNIAVTTVTLNEYIRKTTGPKTVLGYSQGAQVAGTWLRRYAHLWDAPPADELNFVLIGNPERKYGKQPWTKNTTPDWTQYKVRDVARRGDNWADYNPNKHPRNRYSAMFGRIHTDYWKTDIFDPKAEVIKVVGNTEYVIVP